MAFAVPGYFMIRDRETFSDPYSAIPSDAAVIIETIDLRSFLNSLTTGKGIFGEISRIKDLAGFNENLKIITDNLNKPDFRKFFSETKALISLYADGEQNVRTLLVMPVPDEVTYRHLRQALISSGVRNLTDSEIDNVETLQFRYSDKDTAFVALKEGLLFSGNSSGIMVKAYMALGDENDIRNSAGLSRIMSATGNDADKVYIIYDNIAGLIKPLLPIPGTGWNKHIAAAGGAGIYFNENGIVLSGYTDSKDPGEYLHRFKNIPPGQFRSFRILPSVTAMFESVMYNDSLLSDDKTPGTGSELATVMKPYIGSEVNHAIIDIRENPVEDNHLIIYELKDPQAAEEAFLQKTGDEKTIMMFAPDDQISIPVYRLPDYGVSNTLLPGFAPNVKDSLFAFYDNFLITGSSYLTIARVLYDNLLNNTLANDITYRDFENSLPSRSGYFFYVVPSRILNYLDGFLSEEFISALKKNRSSVNRIQAAGYQLASSNDMIYSSLSLKYKEWVTEESSTEWETLLDTVATGKPFFFTNHLTGAQEIFVQDFRNNAYLINAAGRILWKVPLREKITSPVYMIDYYKNGKLQLLFSSKNYLHLLDRNGNYVERYPVKLRSPATSPVALFDYENNRNYRLMIAGENRLVYAYDKSGNVVKGWNPFKTAGTVSAQINHFRISGKDYIAVTDDRALYLLDRSGNKRVTLSEQVTRAPGSSLRMIEGSQACLVCTSSDGTIQKIYFDGKVDRLSFRKFTGEHSFDIMDINGDGFEEFIFIDQGTVYYFDKNGQELVNRNLGSLAIQGPATFSFSATDRRIGVLDMDKKLIYLLDSEGEITDGFPLKGVSLFSIGRLADRNSWNLIVGGSEKFLLNYKIETGS